jgi:hypothetical protein
MERLLLLRLEAIGCAAEAHLNGLPVLRVGAPGGCGVIPVHEYTCGGANRLELVVAPRMVAGGPSSEPRIATAGMRARLQLGLAHQGQAVTDPNAHVLANKDWAPADGDSYEAPLELGVDVDLPVSFPRWRWLDAPPVPENASIDRLVLEFVQRLAVDFARGDPERYLAAARLRFDELAVAYQRGAAGLVQQFRDHLQALYAAKSLVIAVPTAADLKLRRVADGRLVECLGPMGETALRTAPGPDGAVCAWPLRLAVVENRIYVLR